MKIAYLGYIREFFNIGILYILYAFFISDVLTQVKSKILFYSGSLVVSERPGPKYPGN